MPPRVRKTAAPETETKPRARRSTAQPTSSSTSPFFAPPPPPLPDCVTEWAMPAWAMPAWAGDERERERVTKSAKWFASESSTLMTWLTPAEQRRCLATIRKMIEEEPTALVGLRVVTQGVVDLALRYDFGFALLPEKTSAICLQAVRAWASNLLFVQGPLRTFAVLKAAAQAHGERALMYAASSVEQAYIRKHVSTEPGTGYPDIPLTESDALRALDANWRCISQLPLCVRTLPVLRHALTIEPTTLSGMTVSEQTQLQPEIERALDAFPLAVCLASVISPEWVSRAVRARPALFPLIRPNLHTDEAVRTVLPLHPVYCAYTDTTRFAPWFIERYGMDRMSAYLT